MSKFRPMKGVPAPKDLTSLRYPLLTSEKLDGWRCLVCDVEWARANIPIEPKHQQYFDAARWSIALSASLKPISNWHVQQQLDTPELHGCDGELRASERFNETSSAFATHSGSPAFAFHIFDLFDQVSEPFGKRLLNLQARKLPRLGDNVELHKHPHFEISDADHLTEYLEEFLPADAEGAITRDPLGRYKFGRSTEKQGWMLKIKPFEDFEAVIVGFEELMHNDNVAELNQLGLQRRSHHQDGKVPGGKLGALICEELKAPPIPIKTAYNGLVKTGNIFKIGTGFTDSDRHLLWVQRYDIINRIVKAKKIRKGVKDKPRSAVFLGLRAEDL